MQGNLHVLRNSFQKNLFFFPQELTHLSKTSFQPEVNIHILNSFRYFNETKRGQYSPASVGSIASFDLQ